MSKGVQMVRSLVEQRLAAAVEEIFGVVERTIVEYEDELCRTEEENQRQKQKLDSFLNPQVVAHPPGVGQLPVFKEDILSEQEEDWTSPSADPEPSLMKEEQEETREEDWTSSIVDLDPETPPIKAEQEEMRINDTEQLISL